jgi:hypothetical protein
MSKKYKTLLPFSLYESLENLDDLSSEEMQAFLLSLKRYCDSTGRDYAKVCKELELEEPTWSGKLTPRQIEALNKVSINPYDKDKKSMTWSVNPETGLVDVKGDFVASRSEFFKGGTLGGIKFGVVEGKFDVYAIGLTTLEGCPREIRKGAPGYGLEGNFRCGNNKIENLIGGPIKVEGFYTLENCYELKSLEGMPEEVGGYFSIQSCREIGSLEGAQKLKATGFVCSNTSIKNLKGAPEALDGKQPYFKADNCYGLTSLEGAPKLVQDGGIRLPEYSFENCENLYTLEGLPLEGDYLISLSKNGLKPIVLKNALMVARKSKSWIVAYLSMFTDPEFIKTGKAPKDPIREKLAPDNIKKEIEENGERFVVGLKSIWNDFRVKKILREIEIPEDTKADADMLSALDDIGL